MELHHYFGVLRRRLWILVLAVIASAAGAWSFTPRTPQYQASAVIYVGAPQYSLAPGQAFLYDPTLLVANLLKTYSAMLASEPIAQDALVRTRLDRSAASVVSQTSVGPVKDTQLLKVQVTDRNPATARDLANGIADAFVDRVGNVDAGARAKEGTVPAIPATVFEHARLPFSPISSGLGRNLVLTGFTALLVGTGIIFTLEYLDLTIKSPAEAERRLELPVLGVIPLYRQAPRAWEQPQSAVDRGARPQELSGRRG